MTTRNSGWTDERIGLLTEMWLAGKSSGDIALALGGVTRNACIGKINRLGLMGRGGESLRPPAPEPVAAETVDPRKEESSPRKRAGSRKKAKAAPRKKLPRTEPVSVEPVEIPAEAQAQPVEVMVEAQAEPVVAADPSPPVAEPVSPPVAEGTKVEATTGEPRPKAAKPQAVGTDDEDEGTRDLAPGEKVSIQTLRQSMCKWPVGDPARAGFHFCGEKAIEGKPYCTAHARLAYQPSNRKRPAAEWTPERTFKARQAFIARQADRRPGKKQKTLVAAE